MCNNTQSSLDKLYNQDTSDCQSESHGGGGTIVLTSVLAEV